MSKKLWILVLFQCLFLLFIASQHYSVVLLGKEIHLKTTPVDPRDPFRGDYASLHYDITQIPMPQDDNQRSGKRSIFVLLEKQGDYYVYKNASFQNKFVPSENQVVLQGKTYVSKYNMNQPIYVTFGIEKAFVEEGKGKTIEDHASEVSVSVKVWHEKAVLEKVYVNGQIQ